MKRKSKNRLNPEMQKVVDRIVQQPFEYINFGGYSETYRFFITTPTFVDNNILNKGDYIIKIFYKNYGNINEKTKKYFNLLSDKKLIPKIYVITDEYIIMDFIKGFILKDILEYAEKDWNTVINKIKYEAKKWWSKGFYHNDLNVGNIIFKPDGNVIFIDPNRHPLIGDKGLQKDIKQIGELEFRLEHGRWPF